MEAWSKLEGFPRPLGLSWIEEEQAYNFALYSKHATGAIMELVLQNLNYSVKARSVVILERH